MTTPKSIQYKCEENKKIDTMYFGALTRYKYNPETQLYEATEETRSVFLSPACNKCKRLPVQGLCEFTDIPFIATQQHG